MIELIILSDLIWAAISRSNQTWIVLYKNAPGMINFDAFCVADICLC